MSPYPPAGHQLPAGPGRSPRVTLNRTNSQHSTLLAISIFHCKCRALDPNARKLSCTPSPEAVLLRRGNKIRVPVPRPWHTTSFPPYRTGSSTHPPPHTPSIRSLPRPGVATHRPFASLQAYPTSNTSASASIVSLVSSVEPRRAIVHAYNLVAGGAEVQFLIRQMTKPSSDRMRSLTFILHSVEGTSQANEYEMSLTFKSGGIEQSLGGKETAIILTDPSMLNFHILYAAFHSLSADLASHLTTSVFSQNRVSLRAVYSVSGFGWKQGPIMCNTESSPTMTFGSPEIPLFTPSNTSPLHDSPR